MYSCVTSISFYIQYRFRRALTDIHNWWYYVMFSCILYALNFSSNRSLLSWFAYHPWSNYHHTLRFINTPSALFISTDHIIFLYRSLSEKSCTLHRFATLLLYLFRYIHLYLFKIYDKNDPYFNKIMVSVYLFSINFLINWIYIIKINSKN